MPGCCSPSCICRESWTWPTRRARSACSILLNPRRRRHRQQQARPKPKDKEGGSAPKNIKSEATEVKAPKPMVKPQIPNPVVASETPRKGADATQGASNIAGPGTGAGGAGNGTGSGAGGNGSGGGGDNGVANPPRLVTPVLTGRDFPRATTQPMAERRDGVPPSEGGRARLRQRMHRRPRDADRSDRQCDVQPRSRPASLPSRAQSQRTSGCRMVRIRATGAQID